MTFVDYYALIILFAFLSVLISKTIQSYSHGEKAIALGKGKTGLDKLLEISFAFGFGFFVYFAVLAIFNLPLFNHYSLYILFMHPLTQWIGVVFLAAALLFFSAAVLAMNDAWRIGIDCDKHDILITNGIFKYTRNPTYLSIIFLFLGFFLLYSNFFFLGSTVFIVFALRHQIKREEIVLASLFKESYQTYKSTTPRYLFFK